MLSVLVLSLAAHAGTPEKQLLPQCDHKALQKEVVEAPPLAAAKAFTDLAACKPDMAKRLAGPNLPRFLSGDEGNAAMVAAIQVGAPEAAIAWIDGLQSDERARAIGALGDTCEETEAVQQFFVKRADDLGDDFWKQRWYRALASCKVGEVQAILEKELDKGLGSDRSRFFAVLETYARGSGGAAVPKLKELLSKTDDAEAQVNIIVAFADAAQVGSVEGIDAKAAAAGVAAIVELAPKLTTKAVDQARITANALGDPQAADALAAVRYKAARQKDGSFLWGAVALEDAQCKNGKRMQRVHVAQVKEPGRTWADQLEEKVKASAEVAWEMDFAERCKGEGTVTYVLPTEPFASQSDWKAWADGQVKGLRAEDAKKYIRFDEQPISL